MSSKTKFEYVSGCICDNLLINNKDTTNISKEELINYIVKILNSADDIGDIRYTLICLVESLGDLDISGPCECCGDNIYTYTLELDD